MYISYEYRAFFHAIFVFLFFRFFFMRYSYEIRMFGETFLKMRRKTLQRRKYVTQLLKLSNHTSKRITQFHFNTFEKNIQSSLLFTCSKVTLRPAEKKNQKDMKPLSTFCASLLTRKFEVSF